MSSLKLKNLTFSYANTKVLNSIFLSVDSTQTVAIVGPSGCGKTTLLHICAALLEVDEAVYTNSFKNTACLFQKPNLLPWKNTLDNLAIGLKAQGMNKSQRHDKAKAMANSLELSPSTYEQYPHNLSGGMQLRVALGRMLLVKPDLMLLDEPFSALDIGLRERMYTYIQQYLKTHQSSLLMITHQLSEALRLADTIVIMAPNPGRIVKVITPDLSPEQRDYSVLIDLQKQLLFDPLVQEAFALDASIHSNVVFSC